MSAAVAGTSRGWEAKDHKGNEMNESVFLCRGIRLKSIVESSLSCIVVGFLLPATSLSGQTQIMSTKQSCVSTERPLSAEGFRFLMETVAEGWNRGNAQLAASCFNENAVFSGPPSPPHRGRKELFEWFGGSKGRELPMDMKWHHILFDPAQQIGVGEFTFRYRIQTHGLVIVNISNGLIANWREYEIESPLPWDRLIGDNRF